MLAHSPLVVPDTDRIEAMLGWLTAHYHLLAHPDQPVTLEARASGLLEIIGALREHCGDVKWFPVPQIMAAPPEAMVALQVRMGDLGEMIGALREALAGISGRSAAGRTGR